MTDGYSLFGGGDWLSGAGSGLSLGNTTGSSMDWLFGPSSGLSLASRTPAPAPTSWSTDLLNALGTGSQALTPLLGLGTSGLGLYSGIKGMKEAANIKEQNEEMQQAQRTAAQTALGSGQSLTNAGTSAMMGGTLPAGLEAQAQQWEEAYRAQVRNYLAKLGGTTSSASAQWEPYIKQQAAIYRQQLAQGLLQPGQQSLNIASGAASRSVGQNQATQMGIGQVLEQANRALASLQGVTGAAAGPRPAAQMEEERRRRAAGLS